MNEVTEAGFGRLDELQESDFPAALVTDDDVRICALLSLMCFTSVSFRDDLTLMRTGEEEEIFQPLIAIDP